MFLSHSFRGSDLDRSDTSSGGFVVQTCILEMLDFCLPFLLRLSEHTFAV